MMRRIFISATVLLALLAVYSLLVRVGIHHADKYRETIARILSENIEMPVQIEGLQGDGLRLHPQLSFSGLHIGAPGQEVFGVHSLELDLRLVQSLFYLIPRLHHVRAEDCFIRLDAPSPGGGGSDGMALPKYLSGIVAAEVQNCRVELHATDGGQYDLTVQDARMRQTGFRSLRLSVSGAHANDALHVLGEIRRDWNGRLHSINAHAVAGLDALPWQRLPFGTELQTQGASAELWLGWHRRRGLNSTARLQADSIRRYAEQGDMHLADASGLFTFSMRDRQHWHMEGRQVRFSSEGTPVKINALAAAGSKAGQLFYSDSVRIEELSAIALQTLPLGQRTRAALAIMQPQGNLQNVLLRMPADKPKANWQLEASVDGLALESWKGVPSVNRLQGQLKVNPSEGSFEAFSENMKFHLALLYPKAQQYRDAGVSLYWRTEGEQILLQGRSLRARLGERGQVQGYFDLRVAKKPGIFAPRLKLHLDGRDINLNQGLEHIPKAARKKIPSWAVDAGGQGLLRQLSVDLRGPMKRTRLDEVKIEVHGDFEGVALTPMSSLYLKGLQGSLRYMRPELEISLGITEGEAFGHTWSGGNAKFQHNAKQWLLRLDTPLTGGTLESTRQGEPLRADLEYLHLPTLQESRGISSSATLALRARIADLRYDGEEKGSWQFAAKLEPGRIVLRELQGDIGAIRIDSRKGDGATLVWHTDSADSRSHFDGEIRFCDWPKIIAASNCDITEVKPDGRIQANLQWPGDPQDFSIEKSTGSARLRLQNGRFLQVQSPGPLRLLELFNIESLFQRLQQDPVSAVTGVVTDVVTGGGGLDYDNVTAVGQLDAGLLILQGPDGFEVESSGGSRFVLTGTVNLRERSFEGELAASFAMIGNLPLLSLLLQGTPALAAGTWVVGKVIRTSTNIGPKAKFRVSGPWHSLKLELIVAPKTQPSSETAQP